MIYLNETPMSETSNLCLILICFDILESIQRNVAELHELFARFGILFHLIFTSEILFPAVYSYFDKDCPTKL